MADLQDLRDEIRDVDKELLRLVARRMDIARGIGAIKQQQGMPLKDTDVESAVLERGRQFAVELGLSEEDGERFFRLLIALSCAEQEHVPTSDPKRIMVCGGEGAMGQWAVRYFESRSHKVVVSDRENPELNGAEHADVVVLATPPRVTADLIDKLAAKSVGALVFDISSLKKPLIDEIRSGRERGLKISSIHPMFGSDASSLVGRNIVICTVGEKDATADSVEALFAHTAASIVRLPIDLHDARVCYISALTHMCNYLFVGGMVDSGFSITDLEVIGSTAFVRQLALAQRVLAANSKLYYEIQADNEETPKMLASLSSILHRLTESIAKKDENSFSEIRENLAAYVAGPTDED
jgi:chorismate mutase/prephenate dehydrogenase